jgi:hypothetical protein
MEKAKTSMEKIRFLNLQDGLVPKNVAFLKHEHNLSTFRQQSCALFFKEGLTAATAA